MRHPHSLTAALVILLASPALAEWPVTGLVVNEAYNWRYAGHVNVSSDGGHGVVMTAAPWHVASRVDQDGAILWSVDPFTVLGLRRPSLYQWVSYVSEGDGLGGLWFATQDTSWNLFAVHFDATGALEGGIAILSENPGPVWVRAGIPDGAGGTFVVWSDLATPGEDDLRATHVNASGVVTGPANGVVVLGGPGVQDYGGAVADGVGGLLVMTPTASGGRLQRLDAALAPKYGTGGRVDASAALGHFSLSATGDGGAFVAWSDGPVTAATVRVQKLDANGFVTPAWPAEGASAALPPRQPGRVHVVADGRGGACVAWVDQMQGNLIPEVRVSRVLANGRIASGWQPAGVTAGGAGWPPSLDSRSVLVADGTGGCYIAWMDGALISGAVFAQHLAPDGRIFPGWPAGGLQVSGRGTYYSPTAHSDGAGGVYVAWDHFQYPSSWHTAFLTRLAPGGQASEVTPPQPSLSLARVAPNPASGLFTVSATMPDDRPARLEVFDLAGRVSHVREFRGTGEQGLTLDSSVLTTGVHWMRLTHPTGVRMARIVVVH